MKHLRPGLPSAVLSVLPITLPVAAERLPRSTIQSCGSRVVWELERSCFRGLTKLTEPDKTRITRP